MTVIPSDVFVIGYGSLMSGLGLQQLGRLRVRGVARVAILNAQRGFGKFSQHGDRFAMVLEPIDPQKPIEARLLESDAPAAGGPEGLAFLVQPNDLARLAEREGYSSGAIQRLREEAARRRQDLSSLLWEMLNTAGFSIVDFRQQLFRLVGYTSPHYLPHPVRIEGNRFGLTFVAPGSEGSGSDRVVPVRVRTGAPLMMSISEAWHRKPNRTQLAYFATCLLAGVHGVCIDDLLAPLQTDVSLRDRLRPVLAAEQPQELVRFLDATGLDHNAYRHAFGPTTQALRRSSLDRLLRG